MRRIRTAMAADPDQEWLLHGIVEPDETYVGGKPRKGNKRGDVKPNKRGRGTNKVLVMGAVERDGRVVARVANPANFLQRASAGSWRASSTSPGPGLVTDEYKGYSGVSETMLHAIIAHAEEYADGQTHTNTIESFWA